MFRKRSASDRGHANHGWLDTKYTFSFSDYYDPEHMGFRALRVMNEDVVKPGSGFPPHPHRDMEIVTFVLDGELEHQDSLGNKGSIHAGQVQRITAGSGIHHSEFNPSQTKTVHLYQIWIQPSTRGLAPSYEERNFGALKPGESLLIASPDGRDGSATIQRDATITAHRLASGQKREHVFGQNRHGWVQVLQGEVDAGPVRLKTGDGLAISGEDRIALQAESESKILVFDLD